MRRCWVCGRIIWPWQHSGWLVRRDGKRWFHSACYRKYGDPFIPRWRR